MFDRPHLINYCYLFFQCLDVLWLIFKNLLFKSRLCFLFELYQVVIIWYTQLHWYSGFQKVGRTVEVTLQITYYFLVTCILYCLESIKEGIGREKLEFRLYSI